MTREGAIAAVRKHGLVYLSAQLWSVTMMREIAEAEDFCCNYTAEVEVYTMYLNNSPPHARGIRIRSKQPPVVSS